MHGFPGERGFMRKKQVKMVSVPGRNSCAVSKALGVLKNGCRNQEDTVVKTTLQYSPTRRNLSRQSSLL